MIVFLGGVFLPAQTDAILRDSRGVVQNAADALQKAFLKGFGSAGRDAVSVVNLPFVGGYPKGYRRIWFPRCAATLPAGIVVRGESFFNLRFVRFLSRFASAFRGLCATTRGSASPAIVVYSAHLPFLAAARLLRACRRDVFLCVILPDLPEFMGVGGRLYRVVKAIESALLRRIVRGFDSFVLLTDAMGERLGVPRGRRIVVEGIFDPADDPVVDVRPEPDADGFVVLYTGTLAARYGIVDLLTAFAALDRPDAVLWICGEGDARDQVEAMVRRDARVRYFGQVPRARALALQRQASVLVNPRRPQGEFTKYSFPSKTMEYLASGRPVIMHDLPGIPPEYRAHLILPPTPDTDGLAAALREAASRPLDWCRERGAAGRVFVLSRKSPQAQVARILDHWHALGRD